ncbi:hypothetical protein [Xanthomonas sp. CFBP 7698]|uniref:hypothetical protein n=1 Tax=Xanthomonas sp. CFBP 7698 TaxID=2082399 RepID=UPI001304EE99|nr:hypothetical protein [Xanthomonas sp. CFBP 7698]
MVDPKSIHIRIEREIGDVVAGENQALVSVLIEPPRSTFGCGGGAALRFGRDTCRLQNVSPAFLVSLGLKPEFCANGLALRIVWVQLADIVTCKQVLPAQ